MSVAVVAAAIIGGAALARAETTATSSPPREAANDDNRAGADSSSGDAAKSDEGAGKPAKARRGRWLAFPIISSSPETSLMLGGLGMYHFHIGAPRPRADDGKPPRPSAVGLAAAYTFKNQFIFSLFPNIYLQGERWNIDSNFDAAWFPNTFYAIGSDSDADSAEAFTERSFGATALVTRALVSAVRVGGRFTVRHSRLTEVEQGGLLDGGGIVGSAGGRIVGIGPSIAWDNRDKDMSAASGALYRASVMVYPGVFGSDYGHGVASVDARRYMTITGRHVIAVQAYARMSWGDVPFQNMARLGGSNAVRGYFDTRHVDYHMLAAQAEYRFPLWWRISGTAFAGTGDVARRASEFAVTGLKAAAGGGLRYSLNPKDRVNLRFDLAYTLDGDSGFYISIGEAF